jgi:hypothetical protein
MPCRDDGINNHTRMSALRHCFSVLCSFHGIFFPGAFPPWPLGMAAARFDAYDNDASVALAEGTCR